jgi:hypothetical protein
MFFVHVTHKQVLAELPVLLERLALPVSLVRQALLVRPEQQVSLEQRDPPEQLVRPALKAKLVKLVNRVILANEARFFKSELLVAGLRLKFVVG